MREGAHKNLVILQKSVAGISQASLDRFLTRARRAVKLRGKVNVLITSSPAIRALNREFRDQNKATDVLSFPALAGAGQRGKAPELAGEIAICADIALQNSFRYGHSPTKEIKILTLHGLLHLAGFDHERDNGTMARKEQKLRRALGLPVGLIERATPAASHSAKGRGSPRPASRRTA